MAHSKVGGQLLIDLSFLLKSQQFPPLTEAVEPIRTESKTANLSINAKSSSAMSAEPNESFENTSVISGNSSHIFQAAFSPQPLKLEA